MQSRLMLLEGAMQTAKSAAAGSPFGYLPAKSMSTLRRERAIGVLRRNGVEASDSNIERLISMILVDAEPR